MIRKYRCSQMKYYPNLDFDSSLTFSNSVLLSPVSNNYFFICGKWFGCPKNLKYLLFEFGSKIYEQGTTIVSHKTAFIK